MKSEELNKDDINKILSNFARDLTYHTIRVENGKPILPAKSKHLIKLYTQTIFESSLFQYTGKMKE